MLAPEELASLRGAGEASLSGLCDIVRKVRTRQPNGSWRDTPEVVASGVRCRKVPTGQTPQEQAIMQTTLGARGVSTFILDGAIAVYADDTLRYGGKDYGVAGVHSRTDGIYVRVIVYDDSMAIPATP